MDDLKRLYDEHLNLSAIARRLGAIIALPAPPSAHELYTLRMKFASMLIRHLKTEDWILYPRLLRSSDSHAVATSRAFTEEMGGLAKAFGDYCERWKAYEIEHDWKGYQRETAEILGIMARRMLREERELYPLLETHVRAAAA